MTFPPPLSRQAAALLIVSLIAIVAVSHPITINGYSYVCDADFAFPRVRCENEGYGVPTWRTLDAVRHPDLPTQDPAVIRWLAARADLETGS